jgi:glutathione S-transferase
MITLFHSPDSRSSRFIWLLEELAVEYELTYVDIPRFNGKGAPDPRNPHPDKRVPALLHDGRLVTESAAIALYLTDSFPAARFGASVGDPNRASYLTWLAFYAGEIEPAFELFRRGWIDQDPRKAFAKNLERVRGRIISSLARSPFLLGDAPTAADILVSGPFEWSEEFGPKSDSVDRWIATLKQRPAACRAAARDEWPKNQ